MANEVIVEVAVEIVRKSKLLVITAGRGGGTGMMEDGSFVGG